MNRKLKKKWSLIESRRLSLERAVLNSHTRWSLLARLALGDVIKTDGGALMCDRYADLYRIRWFLKQPRRDRDGAYITYDTGYIHPRWLAKWAKVRELR